jgi:hypothetical protein
MLVTSDLLLHEADQLETLQMAIPFPPPVKSERLNATNPINTAESNITGGQFTSMNSYNPIKKSDVN